MCGIVGWVEPGGGLIDERAIRTMMQAVSHRGPDGEGIHIEPGCGLGHRRLALIDPQRGAQPIANESQDIHVVANSEIYNYVEIRDQLTARGHRFCTDGDTEVIVHLYEDRGVDFVHPLVGMFAFALWDRRAQTLLLVRDRLGVKPLYYFEDGRGGLRFASELRALLAVPGIDTSLDQAALAGYLRDMTIPEPATALRRVRKVPAGHYLLWRGGRARIARYWQLPERLLTATTGADHESDVERALLESTALTMRSDAPLGLFLSGGVDSSLLVWAMRRVTTAPVRTFSVGFAEATFDESAHSRRVATALETQHREILVGRDEAAVAAQHLTEWFDEPFADSSAIPTYLLSRHASREVKGVLTGEGADELFGGNPWHDREGSGDDVDDFLAPAGKGPFSLSDLAALLGGRDAVSGDGCETAVPPPHLDSLHRRLFVDLSLYLPSDLLTKIDRMSMLCSLEARVPYLNHPFVEKVWALPSSCKIDGLIRKAVLRSIARRHLPAAVVDRPKQGFAIPIDIWLWQEGSFRDLVYDTLRDRNCRARAHLDFSIVDRLLEDHHRARRMSGHGLWCLFVLERWLQQRPPVFRPAAAPPPIG